jgi:NAD(P)-dependent dehydrogenase (short-subunit alcohol dehydrogenase family)
LGTQAHEGSEVGHAVVAGHAPDGVDRVLEAVRAVAHDVSTFDVPDDPDPAPAVATALAAIASSRPIDVVVVRALRSATLVPRDLAEMTPLDWDEACERPLREAVAVIRHAYGHLKATGGSLVVVCPTTGLQGAAGFAALAAVSEGQRILAKSAARQWFRDGVRVNVIAPPIASVVPDSLVGSAALADAVRGRIPAGDGFDVDAALRSVLSFLASPASRCTTGVTIPVDGAQVTAL